MRPHKGPHKGRRRRKVHFYSWLVVHDDLGHGVDGAALEGAAQAAEVVAVHVGLDHGQQLEVLALLEGANVPRHLDRGTLRWCWEVMMGGGGDGA